MRKNTWLLMLAAFLFLVVAPIAATESEETSNNAAPIHLTKDEFLKKVVNYVDNPNEWVYLGDKPCLIDFYANWCGPCRRLAPTLDELAKMYAGQIYIYKINTDEQKELASLFNIRSIPTLLFVPMKGQPQLLQGAVPKETLVEAINSVLLGK